MNVAADVPRTRRGRGAPRVVTRNIDYHNLKNPFQPQTTFSDDQIQSLHECSLRVLQELGLKVLLPEAREMFRKAGAKVDEDSEFVYIGREIVEEAIKTAPKSFTLKGGDPKRDLLITLGQLTFMSGAGAPHFTDLTRGRRPGTIEAFEDITKIAQNYDVLQLLAMSVEPQDVPTHLRHYATVKAQLTLSDKVPSAFARGTPQNTQNFEMVRDFRGISDEEFTANPYIYTVINTNSPRQIDIPMAQGLIDYARYGQMAIVTPFCMMGAMAPVSVAGAIMLSHAEAMAGITLNQLANPGAPIMYGSFSSNVDLKSGAPAFGTPEQVKAIMATGQMARLLGLPYRGSAGCAANINDAQAANETQMSAWGAVLGGATMIKHAAGWLEGGLTVSLEKMITDIETLQIFAELCTKSPFDEAELAFEAVKEVQPGGHFFAATHTMERYQTVFYEPMIADWSNIGTWTEKGSKDATQRASEVWQNIVRDFDPPASAKNGDRLEQLDRYIEKRTAEGGAAPVS